MEITLPSGRKIGDGHPVFIIAEVGSNWQTLEHCLHSIAMAKTCGADAVKFQAFTDEALWGIRVNHVATLLETIGEVVPGRLPIEWLPKLKAKADACGIEFMCSAFSPELVDEVDPYVNVHKVASAELTHVRMLERLAKKGKPVVMSTGASGQRDIHQALTYLDESVPVVLLYCVAAYPARVVHMGGVVHLREQFGTITGFSDHTTDALIIPAVARDAGACVIEKHVNFEGVEGPDAPHSLTTDEFRLMVQAIRATLPSPFHTPGEDPMRLRHNRRLIATRDIAPGVMLEEGVNFGIYRSLKDDTKALSPWAIGQVQGRVAKGLIKAGDGIGPSDIE